MAKPRTLSVLPNRYLSLDSEGRPNAVPMRVDTPRPDLIGAVVSPTTNESRELIHVYQDEPVTLPDHPTHRRLLQSGQLLAADEATAKLVGIPFVPLAEALETARLDAVARYAAETGDESEFLKAPLPPPKAPSKASSLPALPIPSTAADKSKDA